MEVTAGQVLCNGDMWQHAWVANHLLDAVTGNDTDGSVDRRLYGYLLASLVCKGE